MLKSVTNQVAVGCVTEPEVLQQLTHQGYQTLIDLCPGPEGTQMDPTIVESLGIQYVHIPVSPQNLNDQTLKTFQQALDSSPQPVYVRCSSGIRAGVLTLLTLAEQEGWTESQYLAQRQALGLEHKPGCLLAEFAQSRFKPV